MPYDDMKMYSSSDQRELDLREIDKYDSMNPELFYDYVDRLENAKSFLDTHITDDRSGDLKRSMLAYSGLAGGMTNFWSNPYEYTGFTKNQADQYKIHPDYTNSAGFGYMQHTRPYNLNAGVKPIDQYEYPSTRLLPHEMSHSKELLNELNRDKGYGPSGWEPNFSPSAMRDMELLKAKQGPYYQAYGMGTDKGETMAYLRGREGELRKGKTLMDDPATREVFKKYPGSYDEYLRSSTVLKRTQGKK